VDHELEVIRDEMEATRSSLANKIEALESQVLDTVHSATETVASAVDGAKEVVSTVSEGAKNVVEKVAETVETVKESLSVSRYVERYPWASMAVAAAAGFGLAQLIPSRRSGSGDYYEALPPASSGGYTGSTPAAPAASAYQPSTSEPSRQEGSAWSNALSGVCDQVFHTVEGLAVGSLMGAIKEMVSRSLPQEWQGELNRLVDDTTSRLGGKVIHGNPLSELLSAFRPKQQDQENRSERT
jgi:ElaB/YqjD/DUF883 family membrane-anchored ribosome-binding protein